MWPRATLSTAMLLRMLLRFTDFIRFHVTGLARPWASAVKLRLNSPLRFRATDAGVADEGGGGAVDEGRSVGGEGVLAGSFDGVGGRPGRLTEKGVVDVVDPDFGARAANRRCSASCRFLSACPKEIPRDVPVDVTAFVVGTGVLEMVEAALAVASREVDVPEAELVVGVGSRLTTSDGPSGLGESPCGKPARGATSWNCAVLGLPSLTVDHVVSGAVHLLLVQFQACRRRIVNDATGNRCGCHTWQRPHAVRAALLVIS
jgi:hypothetical protein